MERFDDITVQDHTDRWVVSGFEWFTDNWHELEVSYWDLVHFTQEYYSMTRKEAIDHLLRCESHETEKLLKEYFKLKNK